MQRFSLVGITKHIHTINIQYFDRAERVKIDFRSKILAEAIIVPGLGRFPVPIQQLLAPEVQEGKRMADDGELPPSTLEFDCLEVDGNGEDFDDLNWSTVHCECRFYRRWKLPCKHLFQHHFISDCHTLTEVRLQQWSDLWQQNGFELYEATTTIFTSNLTPKEPNFSAYDRVAAREVTESLLASFYELERAAYNKLGSVDGSNFVASTLR